MRIYAHGITAILFLITLAACGPAPVTAGPNHRPEPTPTLTLSPQPPASTPTPTLSPTPASTATDIPASGDAAEYAELLNPCAVLTVDDVRSIAPWVETLPGQESQSTLNGSQTAICRFSPGIEIKAIALDEADGDPRLWLTTEMGALGQEVPDLGEAAFWSERDTRLGILRGRMVLTVAVVEVNEGYNRLATARALASMVLPRLGVTPYRPGVTPLGEELASCDVLTRQEAGPILGPLINDPELFDFIGEGSPPSQACIYRGTLNQAMVDWTRFPSEDGARAAFQGYTGGEPVGGLGDEAAWAAASLKLVIRREAVLVVVSITLPDDALDQAVQIGQIATPRIP